jgi:hypothetical protein
MEQDVARRIAAGVRLQVVRSRQQEAGQDRWLSRAEDLRAAVGAGRRRSSR